VDPAGEKHFCLKIHYLKRLVTSVERGEALDGHEHVPKTVCEDSHIDEQETHYSMMYQGSSRIGSIHSGVLAEHVYWPFSEPSLAHTKIHCMVAVADLGKSPILR
jgi:hypothetical protein